MLPIFSIIQSLALFDVLNIYNNIKSSRTLHERENLQTFSDNSVQVLNKV